MAKLYKHVGVINGERKIIDAITGVEYLVYGNTLLFEGVDYTIKRYNYVVPLERGVKDEYNVFAFAFDLSKENKGVIAFIVDEQIGVYCLSKHIASFLVGEGEVDALIADLTTYLKNEGLLSE